MLGVRVEGPLWVAVAFIVGTGFGWWLYQTVESCGNVIIRSPICP
jgi:hypothetical protein